VPDIAGLAREPWIERRQSGGSVPDHRDGGALVKIERIATRSAYEAGERGILELLDAYRTGIAAAGCSPGGSLGISGVPATEISNWNFVHAVGRSP
jgi:hypothetical protein